MVLQETNSNTQIRPTSGHLFDHCGHKYGKRNIVRKLSRFHHNHFCTMGFGVGKQYLAGVFFMNDRSKNQGSGPLYFYAYFFSKIDDFFYFFLLNYASLIKQKTIHQKRPRVRLVMNNCSAVKICFPTLKTLEKVECGIRVSSTDVGHVFSSYHEQ